MEAKKPAAKKEAAVPKEVPIVVEKDEIVVEDAPVVDAPATPATRKRATRKAE